MLVLCVALAMLTMRFGDENRLAPGIVSGLLSVACFVTFLATVGG